VQLFSLDPYEFLERMKSVYGEDQAQKGFEIILNNTEIGHEENKYSKL